MLSHNSVPHIQQTDESQQVFYLFIYLFYLFIYLFMHSFIHSFIHSLIHSYAFDCAPHVVPKCRSDPSLVAVSSLTL
jgi:hypothetical protein